MSAFLFNEIILDNKKEKNKIGIKWDLNNLTESNENLMIIKPNKGKINLLYNENLKLSFLQILNKQKIIINIKLIA